LGGADNTRLVRYGDTVTVWSWKNAFIRGNKNGNVDISGRLNSPDDIPRRWAWEYFVIEDANEPQGPGNRGPVKFGDSVYLKTWNNNFVGAGSDNTIKQTVNRKSLETFMIESPEVAGKSGNAMTYGDMFYFKTWRKTYICIPENGSSAVQSSKKDASCQFRIYDSYG